MNGFGAPSPDAAVYVISVAAELTGLHPQTLRAYERIGLITPSRTGGRGRRYSHRDLELLRRIADLTSSGIGLEGVRRILELDKQVEALRARNEELATELSRTRAALRRSSGRPSVPQQTPLARPVNRLPVLREPEPTASLVVWRRTPR